MPAKPPKPVCRTFIMCRRIIKDEQTKESILLAPLFEIYSPTFPLIADVSIYSRIADANGTYQLELQLLSLEGEAVWRESQKGKLEAPNPLATGVLEFPHRQVFIPRPGKYEMVLLANGEDIFRDVLFVKSLTPPPQPPRE